MIVAVGLLLVAYGIVMPALHVHDRVAVLLLLVGVACPFTAALFLAFRPSRPATERDDRLDRVDRELREMEGRQP